jgi:hypothetical protein
MQQLHAAHEAQNRIVLELACGIVRTGSLCD